MRRHGFVVAGLLFALFGCGSEPPPPYPIWSRIPESRSLAGANAEAFSKLQSAALVAENAAPSLMDRVYFTPGQRDELIEAIAPATRIVESLAYNPVPFEFQIYDPFGVAPNQSGWRAIGRSITWQIEAIAENQRAEPILLQKAVLLSLAGTKFGFDLTGGNASDAALGLGIVDDIRRAILPLLPRLGAAQLGELRQSLQRILTSRPNMLEMAQNEKLMMLARVQAAQDSYAKQSFETLSKQLGSDARDAIEYLRAMKSRDDDERPTYFKSLAREALQEVNEVSKRLTQFTKDREKFPDFSGQHRPWRRLSRHFFQTCRPLIAWNDRTTARSRLLLLACYVLQTIKATGKAPSNLADIPKDLRTDPYTGDNLIYRAAGRDFEIYSMGSNLIDDGAETDDAFLAPDLLLEGSF